jgi:hypothetical protein
MKEDIEDEEYLVNKKSKIILKKVAFHASWIVLGIILSLLYINFINGGFVL